MNDEEILEFCKVDKPLDEEPMEELIPIIPEAVHLLQDSVYSRV